MSENNDFNKSENERYYYEHGRCYQYHIYDKNTQDEDGENWFIGTANGQTDADRIVKKLNKQHNRIKKLEYEIDILEDDNEQYFKRTERFNKENPRYKRTSCPTEIQDTYTNRFFWLEHEGNIEGMCNELNTLQSEKEELKGLLKRVLIATRTDGDHASITVQINPADYDYFKEVLIND